LTPLKVFPHFSNIANPCSSFVVWFAFYCRFAIDAESNSANSDLIILNGNFISS